MDGKAPRWCSFAVLATGSLALCLAGARATTAVQPAAGLSARLEASYFSPVVVQPASGSVLPRIFKGKHGVTPSAVGAGASTGTAGRVANAVDVPMSASAQMVYGPAVQRSAYGLSASETGAGQTLAVVGWGEPISDADLATWAAATGVAPLSSGTGAGQVQWLSVAGGSSGTVQSSQAEVAMDVEYAHAIAPRANLRVYFVPDTCDQSACKGDWTSLEAAVNMAVSDGAKVVTGSWGGPETELAGAGITTFEPILKAATETGVSFFFASGDAGSAGGVEYPASSPWAVAVGGAQLSAAGPSSASAFTGWSRSGGGCSTQLGRPAWQPAVLPGCVNRAVPDLALDADPNTGVPIYFSLGNSQGWLIAGGTSLAAPMAAALYADACAEGTCGWVNPALAAASAQSGAFSPVLTGSNGDYQAGPGWNAVTGWGVPNFAVWRAAMAGVAPAAPAVPAATPVVAVPSATVIRVVPTASPTRAARPPHGPRLS
ncbi:MAG TPA: S53 family peptidase [Chloroflexota bacterium]|nr:S53 family peptidase [Chloroflexota bacterium]